MVAEPIGGEVIEKSQVTISPPGQPVRFAILGGRKTGELLSLTKTTQYEIWYQMYRQHPIVRAAIEKISKYAVSTGFHFQPDDPAEELNKNKEKALKRFFRKSNAQHLLRITYKDMLIYGESFWVIVKSVTGRTPLFAKRLHPKFMSPILTDDDELIGWKYGSSPDDRPIVYGLQEVLHFRFDDPDTELQGLSPLSSLELTVASDLNAMHFNGNFFENSAQTGIVIIVRNSDGEAAKRNREWIEQNYVGTKNAHRPMLIEGDVDVKQSVSRQADMQFVEGRVLNRQEIMTVLDIGADKLNIVEDFRRRQEGDDDNFQQETILPLQEMVVEEINNRLIWEIFGWDDIMFSHNQSSQGTEMAQAKLFKEFQNMGVMSINQIAARLGLPPVGEAGDMHFYQTAAGLIPVDLADEVARRLVANEPLPDPQSGLGTTQTGVRNPPKRTGAEETDDD